MFNTVMTMDVLGNPHNPGDILHINGERWVVTKVKFNHTYSTVYCEPLSNTLARNTTISVGLYKGSIADYLKILCDEYECGCQC